MKKNLIIGLVSIVIIISVIVFAFINKTANSKKGSVNLSDKFISSSPRPAETYSPTYDNYEWGISKEQAVQQVQNNGYEIIKRLNYQEDNSEGIVFRDKLFGNDINVILIFTPISKNLCLILIKSDNRNIGKRLKAILEKKYGTPEKPNVFSEKYKWVREGFPYIVLDYQETFSLFYYSYEYYPIYTQEKRQLNEKRVEDKF